MGRAQDLWSTNTLEDPGRVTEILSAYQEYKDKRGKANDGSAETRFSTAGS